MILKTSAARALHSFAVESAFRQDDWELACFIAQEGVGLSLGAFMECLDDGRAKIETLIDHGTGNVFLRVLVRGDEGIYHGLCHPPAQALGLDSDELRVLLQAQAAVDGIEPEQIDYRDLGYPEGEGPVVPDDPQ